MSILFSTQFGIGTIQSVAISIRNLTVFYMAYEIGAECCGTSQDRKILLKHIIICGCVLCILGLLIHAGGYSLYRCMGIHEVYIAKAAPFTKGSFDGRFYTSLFSNKSYVRMGSILYEPINLAYFMANSFICAIFENQWKGMKRGASILCIGLGLILSFGKGGYIISILGVGCYVAEEILGFVRKKVGKKAVSLLIMGNVLLAMIIFVNWYVSHIGLAVLNHIYGITKTWTNVLEHPMGFGLGTGGNAAQVLGKGIDDWFGTGGETAYMSFMYQIGIQGMIFFTILLSGIAFDMKLRQSKLERVFFYMPFILLTVSLLQDNTFTPQCIVPFMLVQGALCDYRLRDKYLMITEMHKQDLLVTQNIKINKKVYQEACG